MGRREDIVDMSTGVATTDEARGLSKVMFARLGELEEGTPEFQYVRNTLIELNLTLVRYAARRFPSRSAQAEDIAQVGTIGLIKAVDRFDPARGVEFTTFALPTILGEIKRFFRDTSWAAHVPRRLQEARICLARAEESLGKSLGRDPTDAELADAMHITEAEVAEARAVADSAYTASSLDAVSTADDAEGTLGEHLGLTDPRMDRVDDLVSLKPLIASLGERDRAILAMRFGAELTQSEIADELGVSQMHVCRLLKRILATLREGLLA
ncbi:SigB/SigF/SigG family RNA polymerase sigma factor [Actinacidiphila oryziradicis]|uniref:SigB/SigF/SigG family RNA polymerase sigma factor n=2 Tax=Actinacidiphila oryziradicis TaxID=2571141 RepID=A0A4U0SQE4_9ACTN|nr:SigB/SigF/SigG family RNA polymerase sigma factor [Actinacidiphila oryziradicis]